MKKAYRSMKKFVEDHRVGITFLSGTTLGVGLMAVNIKNLNNFLKDKNLYEEYYDIYSES